MLLFGYDIGRYDWAMSITELTALLSAIAWPLIALLALLYVWRSDAIGKLIQISRAVDDLKSSLDDVVDAEQRLTRSSSALAEVTTRIDDFQSALVSMKADVESIRDNIDVRPEPQTTYNAADQKERSEIFDQLDASWQMLVDVLREKFEWVDGRMVGSEAYRFAHGNRKGAKLTYDQADEIARLHSAIKSYRRRQSSLDEWLNAELAEEFVNDTRKITEEVRAI